MRDSIRDYIDKGAEYNAIIAALTGIGDDRFMRSEDDPVYDVEEAKKVLDSMIEDKTLACGSMHGSKWLVVREWMPRTAAKLDKLEVGESWGRMKKLGDRDIKTRIPNDTLKMP